MKAALLAIAAALHSMPAASADEPRPLQLRTKSAIAVAAPHRSAPYVEPLGEPEREPLLSSRDVREDESRSSCSSSRALCYDSRSGHIVYKAARNYMPDLPGLQPHGISIKRDKIVLKYTF